MNVFHKGYTPSFLHKPNCRKPVCCGVHTYKHAGKIYVNSVPNLRPTYNPIQPKKGRERSSAGTADRKIALCFAFRKIQRIRCYIRFGKWSPFGPPWREKVEGKKFCVCVCKHMRVQFREGRPECHSHRHKRATEKGNPFLWCNEIALRNPTDGCVCVGRFCDGQQTWAVTSESKVKGSWIIKVTLRDVIRAN